MDDDGVAWLVEERAEAGACPSCGATDARPIVYGMPDFTFFERVSQHVAFFGCCLPEVLHRWVCGRCGTAWGGRQPLVTTKDVEGT